MDGSSAARAAPSSPSTAQLHNFNRVIPRYTAIGTRVKKYSKNVFMIDGYRSDDPEQKTVVLKIFKGDSGACSVAGKSNYFSL